MGCCRLERDFFLARDELQMLRDQICGNPMQIEALAATQDCRQNFLRLRRRKNELHMRRRFFESLQQRIKRRRCEHVHFVNDVNFIASL